jgi:RAB protein geranylgeranyltransferase component A
MIIQLNLRLKHVLHMDRNDYYEGESTSFNLNQVILLCSCCKILLIFLSTIFSIFLYDFFLDPLHDCSYGNVPGGVTSL